MDRHRDRRKCPETCAARQSDELDECELHILMAERVDLMGDGFVVGRGGFDEGGGFVGGHILLEVGGITLR